MANTVNIVRQNGRAYATINLIYYGLVIAAMLLVAAYPEMQKTLQKGIGRSFHAGPLASVGWAYQSGNVWAAILLTFVVNLLFGSVLTITVPSMIMPFSGFLMGASRAILWGLMLSPADPRIRGMMIPHSLTLFLEGQAYILALLAVYVAGKAFIQPRSVGVVTHGKGYVQGLRQTGSLYVLVTLFLAVAAVYEALEVIYLAPLFR